MKVEGYYVVKLGNTYMSGMSPNAVEFSNNKDFAIKYRFDKMDGEIVFDRKGLRFKEGSSGEALQNAYEAVKELIDRGIKDVIVVENIMRMETDERYFKVSVDGKNASIRQIDVEKIEKGY